MHSTFLFLLFLDHNELLEEKSFEGSEGDWAVKMVKHLLTKLAVDNKYVITHYPNLMMDDIDSSGCVGDTSFGMMITI